MYKIIQYGTQIFCILRISDQVSIPFDLANRDYQKYLAWLEAGNTPLPADPTPTEDK